MGEESVMTSVTEVTNMSVLPENTGEQSQTGTLNNNTESTDVSAMEIAETENVPLEHIEETAETQVPADAEMNNDDIISSIVAEAVSQSLEEAGVTEEAVQTEEAVVTVTEYIPVTEAEETVSEQPVVTEAVVQEITEVLESTAITEAVTETAVENVTNQINIDPKFIAVPAVIGLLAAAMAFVKKRSKKAAVTDDDAPMSARDRDAIRLSAGKPEKKKGKKSKKGRTEKEKKNLSAEEKRDS